MKTIKLIGIALCIMALTSCDNNRNTQERAQDRNPLNQNENVDRTRDARTTTQSTQSDARQRDMSQLYRHLNMSQDQINSYERLERDSRSQTSATDQNQNQGDWERRRDQYLRDILTTEQHQRYEQWKRDNQNRNN